MRIVFLLVVVLFSYSGIAQTDSIQNSIDINKVIRTKKLLSVSYYWTSPHTLKNSDAVVLDGIELNNNQGYSINGSIPIYIPKKGNVRLMTNYSYLRTSFNNLNYSINDTVLQNEKANYVTSRYTISPSMIINYKVGNRTVVHMLNVSLNSYDFFNPSYFSGMLMTNIILKRTPEKSSSIGLIIIYSDSFDWGIIPFPMYTYNTFLSPKWTFEMTLPYDIGFRRIQNEDLNIKANVKLDVLNSLFRPQYYNDVARFSDMGVAAGINMEYKVLKYIVWHSNVQYKYSFGTKIKDNESANNIYEFDPNSKFMIQTGLFFTF